MRKEKEKYIVLSNQIIPVYELADGQLIAAGDLFDPCTHKVYMNKIDALYTKLISELQGGKPLHNFKSSKYFQQYIELLKKHNPEYLV